MKCKMSRKEKYNKKDTRFVDEAVVCDVYSWLFIHTYTCIIYVRTTSAFTYASIAWFYEYLT